MNEAELLEALKRSITALKQVKERVRELEEASREPIAVVGMGCRFAGGVHGPDDLWELLNAGVDAVGPIPADRWNADELFDPEPAAAGKAVTRSGGFLTGDVFGFDASFFAITPREVLGMDPQHRLLLEIVWEALEHADILPASLMGSRTGVFVGINLQEYAALQRDLEWLDGYALTGVHPSVASGRISYFLGTKGPSLTVDTACSSSLVAVHLACQSLRAGECDMALAGGAGIMVAPTVFVEFSRLRGLSADGRSKAFDAAADGMGWGEGGGVVVLKRLSSALAAGDRIHAVVRGSAVNQDGRSNGLTAPNGLSQEAVIAQALERAAVLPTDIAYVEAHGAGTPLGDPIEMRALAAVLCAGRPMTEPLLVGSVKSNLGHTMAAAGVAGLIKTVLALRHARIPRSLHFVTPSPHIPWEELPVCVPTEPTAWPEAAGSRLAGVSSFGVSGTNAHAIVEEPPAAGAPSLRPAAAQDRAAHLLVVSARTPESLALQAERYAAHLDARPGLSLGDFCHSAAVARTQFEQRLAVVAASREEAIEKLRAAARGDLSAGCGAGSAPPGRRPKVAFLFTGQGAQYVGMGRELYELEPVFRDAIDRCAEILDPLVERPLRSLLYPTDPATSPLDEMRYAQPAMFAIEYALAALWQSWGVVPDAVMGHSLGEYAAACVAGVFGLADGMRLAAARGRLMHALPADGEMASVKADLERVTRAIASCRTDVSIGAFNGPESIVISGRRESVRAVCRELEAQGVKTRALNIAIASHSPLMDPMLDDFEQAARTVTLHPPRIPIVSNVSGALAGAELATPGYWRRHVREAVRFDQGVRALRALGVDTFVEAGPQSTLLGMGAACIAGDACVWLPSLNKDRATWPIVLESLGTLHVHGLPIAWDAYDAPFARERVDVPTYAFHRQRYRASRSELRAAPPAAPASGGDHALSGDRIDVPGKAVHRALRVGSAAQPYLEDHRILGRVALPGSFHVAMLLAIAADAFDATDVTIRDLHFVRPVFVDEETTLHVMLSPSEDGELPFTVFTPGGVSAPPDDRWRAHVTGVLVLGAGPSARSRSLTELRASMATAVSPDALFARFSGLNVDLGPSWRCVEQALQGDSEALLRVRMSEPHSRREAPLHPVVIDNCIASVLLVSSGATHDPTPVLLWRIGSLRFLRPSTGAVWGHGRRVEAGNDTPAIDLDLFDESGECLAQIEGLTFRRADRDAFAGSTAPADPLTPHTLAWIAGDRGSASRPPARGRGRWLVFADDATRAEPLVRQLRAAGAPASLSPMGDGLADRARIEAALRAMAEAGPIDGVVYWPRARREDGADPAEQAEAAAVKTVSVIQAVARHAVGHAPRLWLVTEGTQAVAAGERVEPSAAVAWGIGRVLMQEHPELRCTLVDLEPTDAPQVEALVALLHAADHECELAVRAGRRYVARLIKASAAPRERRAPSRDGTYLITGGLGGLGLRIAEWFAGEGGARHLALLGRRAPTEQAARRIESIRAGGVSVAVLQADVAERAALERALAAIPRDRPLRGVVHAAGVVDGALIEHLDGTRLRAVLAPKIRGAWHLHELTRAAPLDLFVLFSSIQSLVGSASQGNYAAANAFLDTLAHHRRSLGLVAQSLNWGAWSGDGMAARLDEHERVRLARAGFGTLPPEAGTALFASALERPEAQLVLAVLDVNAMQRSLGDQLPPPILRAVLPSSPRARVVGLGRSLRARLEAVAPEERERVVLDAVRAEVAAVLRLPGSDVPIDRPLNQLGLDSLMALEIPNRLKNLTGEEMPATLLYDQPTVERVTAFVSDRLDLGRRAPEPVLSPQQGPLRVPAETAGDEQRIAVVAMACRAPGGADTPEALWELVARGRSAITEAPLHRGWDVARLADPDPDRPVKAYCMRGGFLHEADAFDAQFFGVSDHEATLMDPQQRLLLEAAWEALERAGLPASTVEGSRTGVFIGVMENGYGARAQGTSLAHEHEHLVSLGSRASVASARVASALGLRGPTVSIDTSCSSSLVALHLACQALRAGECELALAGGATVLSSPDLFVESSRQRTLAPDGCCKPFAESGDGLVWSEGVGILVLERLADARRHGHPIVAVVRGSAVNHNGRGQGLTAPSTIAQREVIEAALRAAGLVASEVDVVEAHGTGTHAGDSIEATALLESYGRARGPDAPLWVGNLKPFIGHAQAAAGVLGVIHTVSSMQRERRPAMPRAALNRNVDWSACTVRREEDERAWPRSGRMRRAGVSAFGVGTNAHVILEESPAPPPDETSAADDRGAGPVVLVVSARTEAARGAQARALADFISSTDTPLIDIAATAALHRTHFPLRAAIIVADRARAIAQLRVLANDAATGRVLREHTTVAGHLHLAAERYVQGAPVDWAAVFGRRGRQVPIPTYAFQRARYWADAPALATAADLDGHPAAGPQAHAVAAALRARSIDDRQAQLRGLVRQIAAEVVGLRDAAAIADDQSLFELGFNSLRAVTLRNRLHALLGVSLSAAAVFAHPTVEAIARVAATTVDRPDGDPPIYEEFEL